jgi:hypothetical protein
MTACNHVAQKNSEDIKRNTHSLDPSSLLDVRILFQFSVNVHGFKPRTFPIFIFVILIKNRLFHILCFGMIIRNLHSRNLNPFYTDFVMPTNLIVFILHYVL